MRFLQAFVSEVDTGQGDKKVALTISVLTLGKEGYNVESQTYTIPDKSSELQKSADTFFNNPQKIQNITKEDYQSLIVYHFMNLDKTNLDYDKVNEKYREVLSNLGGQDSGTTIFDAIIADSEGLLQKEEDSIESQNQEDLEIYEDTISEEFSESLSEDDSDDDHDDDFDEDEESVYSEIDDIPISTSEELSQEGSNLESNLQLAGNRFEDIGYNQNQPPLGSAVNASPASGGPLAGSDNGGTTADLPATKRPKALNQVPVYDLEGLSQDKLDQFNIPEDMVKTYLNGIGGGRLIEPVPPLRTGPGDAALQSENNSGIIATRDEYYKLRSHTKAGAVYMFAGRSPNNIKMEIENPDDPEGKPIIVTKPNDLIGDASYVYLSQKADVDNLLRVAGGTYSKAISSIKEFSPLETRQGISLAAIKADDVVLMSRLSGIRLITGTDSQNTHGADISSKFGIDLIAGNDDSDLQPLVKGNNLKKYLEGLSKSLGQLTGVVADFINSQTKFNASLMGHTHYDPFSIFLGFMLSNGANPALVNGGKGYQSQEVVNAGRDSMLNNLIQLFGSKATGQNRINNDTSAFSDIGAWKILSEKNRTN